MKGIISAILTLSGLGFSFGVLLAWASKKFHVKTDPRVEKITGLLPGINCGACGEAGCASLAELIAADKADVHVCVACSPENRIAIASVLGLSTEGVGRRLSQAAVIGCGGGNRCKNKFAYRGLADCRVAVSAMGGYKECRFACLEQGTCIQVCPVGAISMQPEGVPKVISEKCIGCKKCIAVCPRRLIMMVDRDKDVYINCHSHDKGALIMKKCGVGCIACGKCVKACPSQAITLIDNLAVIDYGKCTNCKQCVAVCPTKTIAIR
ncbi:MAG: RnfABCDGE type electron transport complex subunit B [Candidatus Omnitrophica bacterium]|nr:RnfABCDGE type electron transport complex subunit B [Candidatus Omnitrophota bacterium]